MILLIVFLYVFFFSFSFFCIHVVFPSLQNLPQRRIFPPIFSRKMVRTFTALGVWETTKDRLINPFVQFRMWAWRKYLCANCNGRSALFKMALFIIFFQVQCFNFWSRAIVENTFDILLLCVSLLLISCSPEHDMDPMFSLGMTPCLLKKMPKSTNGLLKCSVCQSCYNLYK